MKQPGSSHTQDMLSFLDAGVSPWHVAETIVDRLLAQGFVLLDEAHRWNLEPGKGYVVVRDQAAVAAFYMGEVASLPEKGVRLMAGHVDSPGLRLKPNGIKRVTGATQLGAEIYGGPILATFADRDMSLAGRVLVRAGSGFEFKRVKFDQPLVKIPSLAIHMNREVNEKGLLLEKQEGVAPLMPLFDTQATPEAFLALLADVSDLSVEAIQGWELALYDTQKAAQLGPKGEWVSSSRIDNLMSCHAILSALLAVENRQTTSIAFFFDHEEVGSLSARGAAGNMLPAVLKRLVLSSGLDEEDYQRCCSHSDLLSVDMAHAWHPAHAASYDPQHSPCLNQGPVIKINSNLRYTTDPHSAARFRRCCETVGVTPQTYIHRNNLPCGSTVGPYLAAATGIRSADIGNPMWGMHSVRETAGTYDQEAMIAALGAFLDRRDES